jgi:hypothetical protein
MRSTYVKLAMIAMSLLSLNAGAVFAQGTIKAVTSAREAGSVINVRVNLSNMLAPRGRLTCNLDTRRWNTNADSEPFDIPGGRFHGTVRVRISPRDVEAGLERYSCALMLARPGDPRTFHRTSARPSTTCSERSRYLCPRPGTAYRTVITGTVPGTR